MATISQTRIIALVLGDESEPSDDWQNPWVNKSSCRSESVPKLIVVVGMPGAGKSCHIAGQKEQITGVCVLPITWPSHMVIRLASPLAGTMPISFKHYVREGIALSLTLNTATPGGESKWKRSSDATFLRSKSNGGSSRTIRRSARQMSRDERGRVLLRRNGRSGSCRASTRFRQEPRPPRSGPLKPR